MACKDSWIQTESSVWTQNYPLMQWIIWTRKKCSLFWDFMGGYFVLFGSFWFSMILTIGSRECWWMGTCCILRKNCPVRSVSVVWNTWTHKFKFRCIIVRWGIKIPRLGFALLYPLCYTEWITHICGQHSAESWLMENISVTEVMKNINIAQEIIGDNELET